MNRGRKDLWAACAFLAPNFLGFVVFLAFPVVFSLVVAFTNWDLSLHNRYRHEPVQWTGLRNFIEILTHRDFWKYTANTLYLMLGIPIGIAGSLFLAVQLTKPLRSTGRQGRYVLALAGLCSFVALGWFLFSNGAGITWLIVALMSGIVIAVGFVSGPVVYRTLLYLPHFTSGVAVFLLWKHIYNPIKGPMNVALEPVLDGLAQAVQHSPQFLWHGLGIFAWVAAVVGVMSLGAAALRSAWAGDSGLGATLLSLVVLVLGALVLWGAGGVLWDLPVLAADGLTPPKWLNDVHWAKPALIIMGLWAAVGSNNMLLYIAGISNIPQELYEAADIDGAGRWQRFWFITWPQLAPTTFFIVIISFIGGLQGGFEQARTMTRGGPFGATTTLSYFVYTEGFETGRLGYGSAIAWLMFVVIFTLTVVNYRIGSSYAHE